MSNVIQFRPRDVRPSDDGEMLPYQTGEIDLLSAVDLAIRDLREITATANSTAKIRARECLLMLEDAYDVATRG